MGENEYIAEGMTASGKRNKEGVFHVIEKRAAKHQYSVNQM